MNKVILAGLFALSVPTLAIAQTNPGPNPPHWGLAGPGGAGYWDNNGLIGAHQPAPAPELGTGIASVSAVGALLLGWWLLSRKRTSRV